MKAAEIRFLQPGVVAYFKIVDGENRGPAIRTAVKVFGIPPDRDGPMLCVTVFGTVSLWSPLTTSATVDRIDLQPDDWEEARLPKLRTSFLSLRAAFMFRNRELPLVTTLDAFEGPRPQLGAARVEWVRMTVEAKHKVVWRAPLEMAGGRR